MATTSKSKIKIFPLLKSSIGTLIAHKEILFPFLLLFFVQVLVVEILYFFPRWPLVKFFGPFVEAARWGGSAFLHYPANFVLLPKLFQFFQLPLYVFFNGFFIGAAITIISYINSEKKIVLREVWKDALRLYFHLMAAAALIYLLALALSNLYDSLLIRRALQIRSESGKFFLIKMMVIQGATYFKLLLSVLATTFFAYLFPIIAVERKNIFAAIILNFKALWRHFFVTFFVVLIPTALISPVFLLAGSYDPMLTVPEISVAVLLATVFCLVMVDSVIYTALTTLYLLRKENK